MSGIKTYEALVRIKNDPSLKPFVEWLELLREKARDKLESLPVELTQVEQGKAQAYREILTAFSEANLVLEKLRTTKQEI